ncbi:MAG: type II secretion system F family protein, partial [Acidimicrobiia bacterium]
MAEATATFAYRVRDRSGKIHSGQMAGASSAAVAKALRDRGFHPVTIEEQRVSALKKDIRIPGLSGRIKVREVSVFSRQFATMINSGLSLLRSLAILAEQVDNRAFRDVIIEVKADVEQGMSLSAAMERQPKAFSRLYVSMVKAGEVGGVLDETLNRLADTLESQVELRQKIKSAMMYPIAVLGLVVLIVIAMLIFVVPMFTGLYEDLGGTLPVPTRVLLLVSNFLTSFWWLATLLGGGTVFGFRAWKRTEQGRAIWDAIKLRLPIFGNLIHKT